MRGDSGSTQVPPVLQWLKKGVFVDRRFEPFYELRMFRLYSLQSALVGVLGKVRQSLRYAAPSRTSPDDHVISCAALIGRLKPLSRTGITKVAKAFLVPSPCHMDPRCEDRLTPVDIWEMSGGISGVFVMERNVEVFLKLAKAALVWNSEAELVYERMRLDSKTFRYHVRRMHFAEFGPSSEIRVPFYLQSAVSVYYLMAKRLLALYEVSHAGLYPRLKHAL